MKLKDNLKLRKIGNKYMIVDASIANVNMVDVYTMNETAALLWKEFETKEFMPDDMADFLQQEYEVTLEQAQKDIENLLEEWIRLGLTTH